MKLQIISLVSSLVFITQVLAIPQDPSTPSSSSATPIQTCVLHCGGPYNLDCPKGYRCCGPIVLGVGGTCFVGETGICPL